MHFRIYLLSLDELFMSSLNERLATGCQLGRWLPTAGPCTALQFLVT
jgi:hypothetical protein